MESRQPSVYSSVFPQTQPYGALGMDEKSTAQLLQHKQPKLIVVVAFDRDDEGVLQSLRVSRAAERRTCRTPGAQARGKPCWRHRMEP